MITIKEIEKLAELGRIELTEEEKTKMQTDLGSILDYVSQLKDAPVVEYAGDKKHINVFREDIEAHDSGEYTDAILKNAPKIKDGYVVVKQVMGEKRNS
ncbi:MAG: Asp-tRNA(Asn)/Glu-tRNA(Gln) amidotransferase subunit GatC [bacterium]